MRQLCKGDKQDPVTITLKIRFFPWFLWLTDGVGSLGQLSSRKTLAAAAAAAAVAAVYFTQRREIS